MDFIGKYGDEAITRLKGGGSTNEMLEEVTTTIAKGGKTLESVEEIGKTATGRTWFLNENRKYHLFEEIRLGDTTTRAKQIMNKFSLKNDREAVLTLIRESLSKGTETIIDGAPNILYKPPGSYDYLRIILGRDPDKLGLIITAFPN